jgi:hypothetical protein
MNPMEAAPKSDRFLSKRRLGWAGLAALLGCAALCALPLLGAAGVGGAAAALTHFGGRGSELFVGGGVFVVALAVMAVRARSKIRNGAQDSCGGVCALPPARDLSAVHARTDTSPENGPATSRGGVRLFSHQQVAEAPIVCTADLTHAQVQIDGYRAAFARLVKGERFAGGFRWTFRAELGLESQLRGLAEREAACCRFVSFDLTADGQHIVWTTTGDDRAAAVLDEYFRLPDRLREEPRRGHDVAALKHAADRAGLGFTAGAGPINGSGPVV